MPHTIPTETHLRTWNPKGDPLGRQELAKNVVENILTKMQTPNVLGVYGDWGTGKTTFLHYLQMIITGQHRDDKGDYVSITDPQLSAFRDVLKNADSNDGDLDKVAMVYFEPWKYEYAKDADLLFALIKQIYLLKEDSGADDEVLSAVFSASQLFRSIPTSILINGVKGLTQGVIDIDDISERMKSLKKEQSDLAFEEYKKWDVEFNRIRDLLEGFIKDVLRNKEKLIIFIDDLDRCLPENTIKLLEAIKNFLSQKNVIFVIAIDQGVVSEMIEKKYALHRGYGEEYLDKIINFQFILPRSEGLSLLTENIFEAHGFTISKQIRDRIAIFFRKFLPQPRKMKKVLRQALVRRLIHDDSGFFDANQERIQYAILAEFLTSFFPGIFLGSSSELEHIFRSYFDYKKKIGTGIDASSIYNAFSQELKDRFTEVDSILSHQFYDATRTDHNANFDYRTLIQVMSVLKYIE